MRFSATVLCPLTLLMLSRGAIASDAARELAEQAVSANPGIAALEDRVSQLESIASISGLWPDPVAAAEYSNVPVDSWALDGHPMAGLQFKLQQTIPFPGVTSLRRDVADSRVEEARAGLEEGRLRLRRAVVQSWWRLLLVRQLRQVTTEHVQLTQQLVAAVRARYETGAAGQHALVSIEVLRDQLDDALHDFDRQERQLQAALASALHLPADTGFDTPMEAEAITLEPGDDPQSWLKDAVNNRPALAQLEASRRSARLAARLARRDALPDLTLWAGYRLRTVQTDTDPGTDLASLGLSLPLSFNSLRAGRGNEAAYLDAASSVRGQREALLDAIASQLESAHAAWSRAQEKARVYAHELLPAARQALDTTLADYRVGKADFSSLFQAEVQLLDLERARLSAVTETHIQDAEVRAITGTVQNSAGEQR